MEHWLFRHNKTKEKARLQSVLKLGLKTFTNTWEWRRFCRFLQHGSILKTKSKVSYLLFPCLCQEWTLEISHWQVAWGICISLSSPGMLAVLPNLLFYWIEICSFEIFSWYVWIPFYLYYNQLESMPREIAVPSTTRLIKGRDQHYSATTIRALLISSSFLCKHTLIWSELGLYFFPWIYWSQTWCLYWHRAWHGICEDEPQACVLQLGRAREICARIRKNLPPLLQRCSVLQQLDWEVGILCRGVMETLVLVWGQWQILDAVVTFVFKVIFPPVLSSMMFISWR